VAGMSPLCFYIILNSTNFISHTKSILPKIVGHDHNNTTWWSGPLLGMACMSHPGLFGFDLKFNREACFSTGT
jgi:hypothetical protein